MSLNVTTAVFGENCNTATASPSLAQWDVGQILKIEGVDLPSAYQVDFSTEYTRNAIQKIGNAAGVAIPNELLQRSAPITAYIVLHEGEDDRETEYWITIHITPRTPPETITPDPEEQSVIDETIAALQDGVAAAEAAATSAEGSASDAADHASDAEAWAVGQRAGADVPDTDPTYHNNSKYYAGAAEAAAEEAGRHEASWESWAQRAETAAGNAEGSASAADQSKTAAETAAQTATQKATAAGESATAAAGSAAEARQTVDGGVGAINTARDGALTAIGQAGTTQVNAVNQAGATQVNAVNQAGATQVGAVENKGAEVLASIPSDYSDLTAEVDDLTRQISDMNNFAGVKLASADYTYKFLQRALNNEIVSFYDLLKFTAGKSIVSDGSIINLAGYSATEDYLSFPGDITVTTGANITVVCYTYDSQKVKTGDATILQNRTATISASANPYIRFAVATESYATAPVTMTINMSGKVFAEIDADIDTITSGMIATATGNLITDQYDGYVAKNGNKSTGNYYYTNSISVEPGQVLSFWAESSGSIVNMQCRFLCAYNSGGAPVEAKGAEYVTAYIVPDGIYSVVVSYSNALTNTMAVVGVARPSTYISTKNNLYIATGDFSDAQNLMFLQRQRDNDQLKEGVLYYLDEKSAVCYCTPDNLTSAKINIYFNGNESTTGSSACFVDFANGTFGFYKAFGVYNASSLVIDSSNTVSFTFNADHEYCIEYKRHSVSPGYTLKITDMMTLESDELSTTNATNGWGMVGYDATLVTVNGFKRLTSSPRNPSVLILGDSYTEGGTIWSDRDKRWCYLLGEAVGSYAINGQGGARSNHIESWIDSYLFDVFTPKYVIVETGTNEQALAYFTRNLTNIIAKIKAIGANPILCTVPVTTAKPNPSDYNTFVLNSGLPYIDICRALTVNGDRVTQNLDYYLADEIHPNIAGHQRIFEMAKLNVPELFRDISL